MSTDQTSITTLASLSILLAFLALTITLWFRERQRNAGLKFTEQQRQEAWEEKRLELDRHRIEVEIERDHLRMQAEEKALYEARRVAEEKLEADASGAGSGGYIVIDMSEKERPLFHDLLKGFEDYANLRGYRIAFSIDSSFDGRIAFKFTIKNDGVVVGPERVRQDFKEYVERVVKGDIEKIDEMPVIINFEEHQLMVAMLKNRISMLQHNYNLSQTAVQFYSGLLAQIRTFPALPAPTVIVQTGGQMDSRNYTATNSSRLIQGESNSYIDSSVNIDGSFNDRQERIATLDDVIEKLESSDVQNEYVTKAQRELGKVRDELAEYPEPDKSSVKKWLEYAKNMMATAALGIEVTEAAKKLWELFGT